MPYYREQLLSAWSNAEIYDVGRPPTKLDSTAVGNVPRHNHTEVGLWFPNSRKLRRNQLEKATLPKSNESRIAAPKFLSEKSRAADQNCSGPTDTVHIQQALADATLTSGTKKEVPVMYRKVEIKYSRFGVDDFDFQ